MPERNIRNIRNMLIMLLCIFLVTTGCASSVQKEPVEKQKLKVAATIFPLADITRNIGGEKVEVFTLLPPGASPHTYEVTPKQVKEFSDIDMYVKIGAGVDDWVDRLASAASRSPLVVTVTENVELKRNGDPHIWLDPIIVKDYIAPQIAGEMSALLPEQEEYFSHNLAMFAAKLEQLHEEILGSIQKLAGKRLISFHSCWGYFCDRYGIEEVASIEEYPGKEPSAAWVADVIKKAKKNEVKIIFAEPQFNPKVAEVIAGEFGGRVLFPDPIGGEGIKGRESYIDLMRYNIRIFTEALAPGPGGKSGD